MEEKEIIDSLIAQMIKRRQELKITQRDLAEKCGIPHSSVARMESGKHTPNLVTIAKILNALDLTLKAELR